MVSLVCNRLRRALDGDKVAKAAAWDWRKEHRDEAAKLLGEVRPGGSKMPVGPFLEHWRHVRKQLSAIVRDCRKRRNHVQAFLYPAERRRLEAHSDISPAKMATLFTWERAGRPGSLGTFARRVGINLGGMKVDVGRYGRIVITGRLIQEGGGPIL